MALGYDSETDRAPQLLAKGKGIIADNIIEKAKENGVPVQEDTSLVEILSHLNVNDQIPEELYQVVAEVFAFIYRTDQEASK